MEIFGSATPFHSRAGRQLTPEEREEAQQKVARFKELQARQAAFSVAERIGAPGDASGDSARWMFGGDAGRRKPRPRAKS